MKPGILDPTAAEFGLDLAALVLRSRLLAGWTQRELARRARTSQAAIWRLERARSPVPDLDVTYRVLAALGFRPGITLSGRHLEDRERQRDGVHAVLNGYAARRLRRHGWATALEPVIGMDRPLGWIDTLAFREVDSALLVEETKADIPDMGAAQRSLAFYERQAASVARQLGWQPRTVNVLLVGLDSRHLHERLHQNRDVVAAAFPAGADEIAAWLRDPAAARPRGWALALSDPADRGARWLRSAASSRRQAIAYEDYADAAARLLRPHAASPARPGAA